MTLVPYWDCQKWSDKRTKRSWLSQSSSCQRHRIDSSPAREAETWRRRDHSLCKEDHQRHQSCFREGQERVEERIGTSGSWARWEDWRDLEWATRSQEQSNFQGWGWRKWPEESRQRLVLAAGDEAQKVKRSCQGDEEEGRLRDWGQDGKGHD